MLDDCLIGFVNAFGNQVLRDLGCRFLSAFFPTSNQRTFDLGNGPLLDRVSKSAQDADGGKHLRCTNECAQASGKTPTTFVCFTFFSANSRCACASAYAQCSAGNTTGNAKRTRGQKWNGRAYGLTKLAGDGFFVSGGCGKRRFGRGSYRLDFFPSG